MYAGAELRLNKLWVPRDEANNFYELRGIIIHFNSNQKNKDFAAIRYKNTSIPTHHCVTGGDIEAQRIGGGIILNLESWNFHFAVIRQ